jgi:hypothetical protein
MSRNIKVIKNEENPETPEVLAASIVKIADGFEKLMSRELTQDALVALLQNMKGMAGIGKREISLVLSNLKKLKSYYIRQ